MTELEPRLCAIKEPEPTRDWSTEQGAAALAEQIRSYWAQRGRRVAVRVEPVRDGRNSVWRVVSDLDAHIPPAA